MTFDVIFKKLPYFHILSASSDLTLNMIRAHSGIFLCVLNNIRYSNVSSYIVNMVYYYMINFREILELGIFWAKPYLAHYNDIDDNAHNDDGQQTNFDQKCSVELK